MEDVCLLHLFNDLGKCQSSIKQREDSANRTVQLLLTYLPRLVYDLHANPEGIDKRSCLSRFYLDEDRCVRRRNHHWLLVAVRWPSTSNHLLRIDIRMPYPSVDSPSG